MGYGASSDAFIPSTKGDTYAVDRTTARLAETIDTHVRQVSLMAGDEALPPSMADYMPTFKQLLDTCTGAERTCSVRGMTASPALRNCWRGWPKASPMGASLCRSDDTVRYWSMM
jgi:hypothetical protein